jgi:hypothetical protein
MTKYKYFRVPAESVKDLRNYYVSEAISGEEPGSLTKLEEIDNLAEIVSDFASDLLINNLEEMTEKLKQWNKP